MRPLHYVYNTEPGRGGEVLLQYVHGGFYAADRRSGPSGTIKCGVTWFSLVVAAGGPQIAYAEAFHGLVGITALTGCCRGGSGKYFR